MAQKGEFVEDASYETMHARIAYVRGRAADRRCEDCGEQAQDWAYDHSDPNPKLDPRGRPYSEDLSRYRSLCRPCHRDLDRKNKCRKGHSFTEQNTYINKHGARFCRTCRREYMRSYRK